MRIPLKLFPRIATVQERRIVLENFLSLSTLQGLGFFLPLAIMLYLIRIIGPARFGLIAFAQSFVQFFMIFTDYGFSLSATRKISLYHDRKEKIHEIFSSVMTVKLLLAGISFILLMVIISFVPKFRRDWLVYLFSFGTVIGNTLFPIWFFQGKEKMIHIASINSIGGIATAVCILFLVRTPQDYLYVPLIMSLFSLSGGVWALYVAFRKFDLEFVKRTYQDIQQELKTGWSFFVSVVAINAYTASRIFAVGLLTSNTLTGFYAAAERIAGFIQGFPMDSFTQSIYPRITKAYTRNKERALKLLPRIQRTTTIGFLIFLPIIFASSPLIVKIICGAAYKEVIITLRLLLVSVFFVGANAFRVQFLLVCGRADLYSKLHVAAALVGLPLIFLLLYLFSYAGAAISIIMIEMGIFFVTSIMLDQIRQKILSKP